MKTALKRRRGGSAVTPYIANGKTPAVIIDHHRGRYHWGGELKAIGDLTEVASKGHTLTDMSLFDFDNFTMVVEYALPDTGYSGTTSLASFGKTTDGTVRFNVNMSNGTKRPQLAVDTPLASLAYVASTAPANFATIGRGRFIVRATAGAVYKAMEQGMVSEDTTSTAVYDAIAPDTLAIGFRQIAGSQDQAFPNPDSITVVIYNGTLTDAEVNALGKKSYDGYHGIYWLGDSISNADTYANGGGVVERIRKKSKTKYVPWATSIVGGSNLEQFYTRFAADTEHHNDNLVIFEGGLDHSGVDTLGAVQDIVGDLPHERWVIGEPIIGTGNEAGTSDRTDHDAAFDAIVAWAGESRIVRTLALLQAENDGSANDLADVANDIVPRSLRSDGIHLNSTGQEALADIFAADLRERGWIPA